jgi:hypothetical protein
MFTQGRALGLRFVLSSLGRFACVAAAAIFSGALSFVFLAHPTNFLSAAREIPPIIFLSALATAPGVIIIGIMTFTLSPRSIVFAPITSVIVGGALGLVVMQCWGYLFGETLLYPDWERDGTLFQLCATLSGSVAGATAGYLMRAAQGLMDASEITQGERPVPRRGEHHMAIALVGFGLVLSILLWTGLGVAVFRAFVD